MGNIRTYQLNTHQNNAKSHQIVELYSEYKNFYKKCILNQYQAYLQTGQIYEFVEIKTNDSKLSERFKRQVMQQATGQLNSWISNRENRITEIVNSCESLTSDQKRKLHLIRIFRIKTAQLLTVKSKKKEEIIDIKYEDIILYKAISRSVKWRLPSSKQISMQLNNNTCKLVFKQKEKGSSKKINKNPAKYFDFWIELSTLKKRKKILIPVKSNKYIEKQLKSGKLLNAMRIDFHYDKSTFNIMIDKEVSEENKNNAKFSIEKIGIDFGTKHLFAISTGQIFGVNFGKKLAEFDRKINTLQKRLQKQNIKPNSSKRYRNLVAKCKSFIKNEINRNLNKIIKEINPKEIILENLDFSGSKLSKSMNRILRKCGRSVIKSKLAMLVKDFGITVVEVNAAYSSQNCKRCLFTHKLNRKNRDKFECLLCNYKKHADINAANNIEVRSSCPVLRSKSSKRTIKNHLFSEFKQNILQCGGSSKTRFISHDRRAIFLEHNPNSFEEFAVLIQEINKL
jgi:putative transposase